MKPLVSLSGNNTFVQECCVMCGEFFETGKFLPEFHDEDGQLIGYLCDAFKRKPHKLGVMDGVVDLMSVIKPRLTVVDAIICQEGLEPIYGKPVEMDLIMASRDLVAADAVCGRIIGYEPSEVMITVKAAERGFGKMKAEVVGESIESVHRRFLRAVEDNPVKVGGFKWLPVLVAVAQL